MISHHEWSPYRQMRWVIVKNVSGQDLDDHAVVEVTAVTEQDPGMQIHEVTLPQTSSSSNTLVLGPMALQAGRYGHATDNNLVFAKVSGTPTIGEEVGTVASSDALATDQTGWIFLGGQADGVARVIRAGGSGNNCRIIRGELAQTTCSGNMDIENVKRLYSGGAAPSEPVTCVNLMQARAEVGDYVYAAYNYDDSQWEVLNVEHAVIEEVEDIRVQQSAFSGSDDTCEVQKLVRDVAVMKCADATWKTAFSPSPIDVIVDVYDDGVCVKQTAQTLYVLCYDEDTLDENVFCTGDCLDQS